MVRKTENRGVKGTVRNKTFSGKTATVLVVPTRPEPHSSMIVLSVPIIF
jgi:hypothetical protein